MSITPEILIIIFDFIIKISGICNKNFSSTSSMMFSFVVCFVFREYFDPKTSRENSFQFIFFGEGLFSAVLSNK